MNERKIKVWDVGVRVFHWSLVVFFTIAWFTGDESEDLHSIAGYVVLALLVFRIIWGFIGPQYARFSNFIYPPGIIIRYLKSLSSGYPEHYYGHNPAGGAMVFLLLINLSIVCWTGLEAWGAEGHGPLAQINQMKLIGDAIASADTNKTEEENEEEEFWEEWHEISTNSMLFLIFLHIAGVYVSSKLHRENLIRAMITGYKEKFNE